MMSILMSAGVIAANLAKAYFIRQLVDYSLVGQLAKVLDVLLSFALVMLGGAACTYLAKLATGKFSLSALRDMKDRLADHLCKVHIQSLSQVQSGDLASRFNNDTELVHNFIKNTLPTFLVQVLLGVGAAIYVFLVNWKLLVASTIFVPFAMYLAHYLNKNAGRYYPESAKYMGEAAGEVEQSLLGIDIIKAFSLRNVITGKIRGRYAKVFQADITAQKYVAVLQPICYAIANFPAIIGIVYGGYLATRGEIGLGTLVGTVQLYEYIIVPAVMLPFIMNRIQRSIAGIGRIAEVFALPEERAGRGKGQSGEEDSKTVLHDVTLQIAGVPNGGTGRKAVLNNVAVQLTEVFFGYADGTPVLTDVQFTLHCSEMTALVGASGSGKSTIVNLLCGLYEIQNGKIAILGQDVHEWNLRSLREQITVVSQDTYLFPGTIEENIRYSRQDAAPEEVVQAAKAAHAHEFITEMPDGYDTLVGEGGANLSGGQRQRISIARAFLKDAPILILDEPTAALDNYSETIIQQAIAELSKGRTVLVIAHRLSTICGADQILVLEGGKIVESGTHQQLVERQGLYYRLYQSQLTA